MTECSNCGRNDGTHANGCFRGWTAENAPPTYAELAAENIALRRQLAEAQAGRLAEVAMAVESNVALHRAQAEAVSLRRETTAIKETLRRVLFTGYRTNAERDADEETISAWLAQP